MTQEPPKEPAILLDENQVRSIVRLLAQALTPDDGRTQKVRRMMDGLSQMISADGWVFYRSRLDPQGKEPANIDYSYGGAFDDKSLAAYADYSFQVYEEPPEFQALKSLIIAGEHFTKSRQDLVPDAIWRSGRFDQHIQRMGLDTSVYSVVPLMERNGGLVSSSAVFFRKPDRPDFDPVEARVVHWVISECGPLHRDGLDVEHIDEMVSLTPRQRSVLVLLMDGLTQKQVADRLYLSTHTVGDHVKAVYRHFNVNSRAGLLRHFIQGHPTRI